MLNRFKNAVTNVMGGVTAVTDGLDDKSDSDTGAKDIRFPYNRPEFLRLNLDEVLVSADHVSRPIIVPRQINRLPWNAGYAEVINSGKTKLNEDQARAEAFFVKRHIPNIAGRPGTARKQPSPTKLSKDGSPSSNQEAEAARGHRSSPPRGATANPSSVHSQALEKDPLPFTYFAIFDGHAGPGAAVMAVNLLHIVIQAQLGKVRELLISRHYGIGLDGGAGAELPHPQAAGEPTSPRQIFRDKSSLVNVDGLVVGALEAAFHEMDSVIEHQRKQYRITGGCTALVALFFLGKLYVANAGDCRAVLVRGNEVHPMSTDFTPESERKRLQYLAYLQPELLHDEFSHLEFPRRLTMKDVGKKVLYRDAWMTGWSCKTVTEKDTRFPLVYGEGKRARVLATIGVTRGFGDHDLYVYNTNIAIKPFLIPSPEVQIYDIANMTHTENDVLIMGSDGLWDVTTNQKAASIVHSSLEQFEPHEQCRYTSAAQDLVMFARGLHKKSWQTRENQTASGDDITVFVIPLSAYCSSGDETVGARASVSSVEVAEEACAEGVTVNEIANEAGLASGGDEPPVAGLLSTTPTTSAEITNSMTENVIDEEETAEMGASVASSTTTTTISDVALTTTTTATTTTTTNEAETTATESAAAAVADATPKEEETIS